MIVFITPRELLTRTIDAKTFVMAAPIDLMDDQGNKYRVPVGAESDGCSWAIGKGPLIIMDRGGPYFRSAVVHDAGYRDTLLVWRDGAWVQAHLTEDQSNTLFNDCMLTDGVPDELRRVLYQGVALFGWRAFREDRNG